MAGGDADDAPYDLLRAPASLPRGESITSQLQREILGELAVDSLAAELSATDLDAATDPESGGGSNSSNDSTARAHAESNDRQLQPRTPDDGAMEPRRRRRADEIEIATPESLSQPSRRHTLSPSKALLFFGAAGGDGDGDDGRADEDVPEEIAASSRRETVSPESIRALLRDLGGDAGDSGDAGRSAASRRRAEGAAGPADDSTLETALQDVARTKEYVASSKGLLHQDEQQQQTPERPRRRRSVDSSEKKKTPRRSERLSNERDQDSFSDAFFPTKPLGRRDTSGDSDHDQETEAATGLATRRSTLEPTDAELIFAELRDDAAGSRRSSPARSSPAPTSRSPVTRSRRRRTTLDPDDLLAIRDGSTLNDSPAGRRETIGDTELDELQRELGGGRESLPRRSSPRRQQNASPEATKRTRFDDNDVVITIADKSDSKNQTAVSPRAVKITPMKRRQRVETTEDEMFMSPPPGPAQGKTPLKSCLSAKKKSKGVTTPNKSVNFGPPQGAQFNRGSPSTSMTPMCAREAKAMFPLEEKPQNQEDDDDDETSLNTSLLDEADALDSEEKDGNGDADMEVEDSRKLSFGAALSSRNRRRYSLRGSRLAYADSS
ncbi:hypothetical protein ATCC90586_002301 [Pythium insidiosum]|nr:hypothetical protein ATCC90586_002301 [Pythium insidiosum]